MQVPESTKSPNRLREGIPKSTQFSIRCNYRTILVYNTVVSK